MALGLDVSDYQAAVDWSAVAGSGQQMAFAFTKATEGTNFVCQSFATNWAAINTAGLVRGAYHFARPDDNTPANEAAFFLQQLDRVGGLQVGDLVALDLEAGTGDVSGWTLAWLEQVTKAIGFRPLLYSGTWFLGPHGCTGNAALTDYGLWLAAYSARPPVAPANWPAWVLWQYTATASVPGVAGPCDASLFSGGIDQLKAHGKLATSVPVPPPPPVVPPAPPAPGGYIVRSGDSLSAIAQALGCTLAALVAVNPQIANTNLIYPGEVLTLPAVAVPAPPVPPSAQIYVVRSGDSLGAIAYRLGVGLLALEQANPGLADPNLIQPGQVLNIPA